MSAWTHTAAGSSSIRSFRVEVVDLKIGGALAADEQMGGEPAVQVPVGAVGDQAENALIVAQIGVAGMLAADAALAAADNRGYNAIPHLQGLSGGYPDGYSYPWR